MKMNYGVCCLSVIPVRADVSGKSEMVSQLLFGETFSISALSKGWANIRTDHDNYEGWIDEKQFIPLNRDEHKHVLSTTKYYSTDLVHALNQRNIGTLNIVPGSILYNSTSADFTLGDKIFSFDGTVITDKIQPSCEKLIKNALYFLNSPYLWGGRTPFGIDCSGFVQIAARLSGISLSRDTREQAEEGEMINLISEAKPGDLAFFDNEEGRIIHVGIILENGQIIHASGKVRIDTIDHQGIFNKEFKKYSHQLRVIKRIIQ